MKKLLAAGAFALLTVAGSAQAAPTITYNAGSGALPTGATIFQNFDTVASGTMIGSNAYATSTSSNLAFRPAYGSTGNFAAVLDGGSYTTAFGPTNLFSFVIGSLDTFNMLTLTFADNTSTTYTGGQIVNDTSFDNGNRSSAETNGTVSYSTGTGPLITGATFASRGGNSFEFDNLASGGTIAAAVPEPAAWGMMILGFGLVGGVLRRRPSTKVSTKLNFA